MHSFAVTGLLLLTHLRTPIAEPSDSVLARKLRWAALDQRAELNLDSALVLIQGARQADPAYLPAQLDYMNLRYERFEDAALRRESVSLSRSADPGQRCLGLAMASSTENRSAYRELLSLERSGGATICSAYFLAVDSRGGSPAPRRSTRRRRAPARAPRALP